MKETPIKKLKESFDFSRIPERIAQGIYKRMLGKYDGRTSGIFSEATSGRFSGRIPGVISKRILKAIL